MTLHRTLEQIDVFVSKHRRPLTSLSVPCQDSCRIRPTHKGYTNYVVEVYRRE